MKEGKKHHVPHIAYIDLSPGISCALPLSLVNCPLQESATEKAQSASGSSEQQPISITLGKGRKQGVNCAAVCVCG